VPEPKTTRVVMPGNTKESIILCPFGPKGHGLLPAGLPLGGARQASARPLPPGGRGRAG